MNKNIVVVAGKRTPFGSFGGSLKDVSATDLGVAASKATLKQVQFPPTEIDHVVFGSVIQSGADAIYMPRHIGLKVGVPESVPALGINRLCGTGFESWIVSAQMILTNDAQCILAGGTEQMSQVPFVVRGARWGLRLGNTPFEDYLQSSLTDALTGLPMAITAENLADKYKIERGDVDAFALRSQQRYQKALVDRAFLAELSEIEITAKKGTLILSRDEHPKPETTLEALSKIRPLFKENGVVTAGSASGIVDGAAASLLMAQDTAQKKGLKPLARIVSWATVGCDPKIMGIGPAIAIRNALARADLKLSQMDLIEVNEAFGAQYLAVEKELQLPRERTNVNGGAIAVGHPLAASGTRIMNHLMYELHRRNLKFGVGSACIGGGQGVAIVIERL